MWLLKVLGEIGVDVLDKVSTDWGVEHLWESSTAGLGARDGVDVDSLPG